MPAFGVDTTNARQPAEPANWHLFAVHAEHAAQLIDTWLRCHRVEPTISLTLANLAAHIKHHRPQYSHNLESDGCDARCDLGRVHRILSCPVSTCRWSGELANICPKQRLPTQRRTRSGVLYQISAQMCCCTQFQHNGALHPSFRTSVNTIQYSSGRTRACI